jgi:hypothetical protein
MKIQIECKNYVGLVAALLHTTETVIMQRETVEKTGLEYEHETTIYKLHFDTGPAPDMSINAPLGGPLIDAVYEIEPEVENIELAKPIEPAVAE